MAFSAVAKNHRVVSNLLTRRSSSSVATNTRGFATKGQFYGSVVKRLQNVILNRIPHTLCCTYESDEDLKALTVDIPGAVKRTETDEAVKVFINMETEDCKNSSAIDAQLDRIHNILFVRACVSNDDNRTTRRYSGRINLGKQHTHNTLFTEMKDGGLLVTLPKYHHPHRLTMESN